MDLCNYFACVFGLCRGVFCIIFRGYLIYKFLTLFFAPYTRWVIKRWFAYQHFDNGFFLHPSPVHLPVARDFSRDRKRTSEGRRYIVKPSCSVTGSDVTAVLFFLASDWVCINSSASDIRASSYFLHIVTFELSNSPVLSRVHSMFEISPLVSPSPAVVAFSVEFIILLVSKNCATNWLNNLCRHSLCLSGFVSALKIKSPSWYSHGNFARPTATQRIYVCPQNTYSISVHVYFFLWACSYFAPYANFPSYSLSTKSDASHFSCNLRF